MLYAISGTLFASGGAYLIGGASIEDVGAGLCGYDGALVGCACWAFLDNKFELTRFLVCIVLSCVSGVGIMSPFDLFNYIKVDV